MSKYSFNYATAVQIIAQFSAGEEISPATLTYARNAYAAHEKRTSSLVRDCRADELSLGLSGEGKGSG